MTRKIVEVFAHKEWVRRSFFTRRKLGKNLIKTKWKAFYTSTAFTVERGEKTVVWLLSIPLLRFHPSLVNLRFFPHLVSFLFLPLHGVTPHQLHALTLELYPGRDFTAFFNTNSHSSTGASSCWQRPTDNLLFRLGLKTTAIPGSQTLGALTLVMVDLVNVFMSSSPQLETVKFY